MRTERIAPTGIHIMPAAERSFADPPPSDLYTDTDVLIAYLVSTEPHHERCRRFFRVAAQRGQTTLYLSSLAWVEFANVVMKTHFRARLPIEWQRRFRLARWQQASVRRAYLEAQMMELNAFLDHFAWVEVPLMPAVREATAEYMSRYGLHAHDAVHAASAAYVSVRDVAALDEAYRRVDSITLWNDLIHAGKPVRGSGGG